MRKIDRTTTANQQVTYLCVCLCFVAACIHKNRATTTARQRQRRVCFSFLTFIALPLAHLRMLIIIIILIIIHIRIDHLFLPPCRFHANIRRSIAATAHVCNIFTRTAAEWRRRRRRRWKEKIVTYIHALHVRCRICIVYYLGECFDMCTVESFCRTPHAVRI